MKISRNTPSIDGPTGIKQTLDYSAFYKENAQNSSVVVTLINKTENTLKQQKRKEGAGKMAKKVLLECRAMTWEENVEYNEFSDSLAKIKYPAKNI